MARVIVVIPTYNEIENLPVLLPQVLEQDPRLEVLVVDDSSPDGTGKLADEMAASDPRVHVHVNDAPDIPVNDQVDNLRCLPGATGVIDIATFLGTLKEIDYSGPVMVEPFSQEIRAMDNDGACAATKAALDKVWVQAGLA